MALHRADDLGIGLMRLAYRADVDGLRAVAVLAVVAFHAFPTAMPGGFTGVDVFFVISGFLIAGLLRPEGQLQVDLAEFFRRRVVRLFPALVVVVAAVLLWGWFVSTPAEYAAAGLHAAAAPLFASNVLLAREAGYFVEPLARPLLHLWSLGVEGQFYVGCTALLLVAFRLRSAMALAFLAAVSVASLAACLVLGEEAFYAALPRAWEFLAGSALALWGTSFAPGRRADAASIAGMVCIAAGLVAARADAYPDWHIVLPVLGAVLLIASGEHAVVNRRLLSLPIAVGIGRISYPLYLWHWVAIWALASVDYPPSIVGRAAVVVLAFALAWATYAFVERPAQRAHLRRATAGLLACGLAVATAGSLIVLQAGVPSRVPEAARPWLVEPAEVQADTRDCNRDANCAAEGRRPLIVVWGDSHAAALAPGLQELANTRGGSVVAFTTFSCPPLAGFSGRGNRACAEFNERTLAAVARLQPDLVVMHARWEAYPRELLENTIERLGPLARRAVVAGPAPRWHGSLPRTLMRCASADASLQRWSSCGLDETVAPVDASLAQDAGRRGVRYWSIYRTLCTEAGCMRYLEGPQPRLTTYDYGHLTPQAAAFAVRSAQPPLFGDGAAR